jgi:PAS domain S-box-containing protein
LLLALAVLLLALVHPLSWPGRPVPLWYPSAGLGLVLVAWLGLRAAGVVLVAVLLAGVRGGLWPNLVAAERWGPLLAEAAYEGFFQAALVAAVWWAYRQGGGAADLCDPRSATLFLLCSAAVVAGIALLRTLPVWLAGGTVFSLPWEATGYWVAQELGLLVLAPPLLVFAGPWLERNGFRAVAGHGEVSLGWDASRLRLVDWLEIAALATATACLSALLTLTRDPQAPGGWQLWGAPLLLMVWAGMRGGLRAATLVAATAAIVSLEVLNRARPELGGPLLVQGNLLAQCSTALLVAASVGWVRHSEARYRRVVAQIPVVLYSAAIRDPGEGTNTDRKKTGEPASSLVTRHSITLVSPPAAAILGCPPEALLGDYDHWLQRIHPDDHEVVLAALAQLSRQVGNGLCAVPVVCEYRLAPGPGEEWSSALTGSVVKWLGGSEDPGQPARPPLSRPRWLRDTLVPTLDAEGRLLGWEGILEDITEQRLLADDLRRTTSMFHALIANLPAGVFFVSARSGRPILVNQRARQLLGQREDFSAGLEHLCQVYRLHRADGSPYPPEELPVCQALRKGTVSMRDDIVVHRPDGRQLPLISWAAPLELSVGGSAGQRIDAVVWVMEDLTDLRQAEAARRETEGRLRTVIESLAEGLLVQDRSGTVIDCNAAARSLLGARAVGEGWLREDGSPLPTDEHPLWRVLRQGVPVRNVVLGLPSEDKETRRQGDKEIERPGNNEAKDVRRPPDGSPCLLVSLSPCLPARWLLVNALPLAPPAGPPSRGRPGGEGGPALAAVGRTPAGVVTTFADITDYVHAQQQLRASEEKYRRLVDSLPLMVVQFDRELRITFANPATQALTGWSLDEVQPPLVWQEILHPDDRAAALAALHRALAGENVRHECRYRSKDGQERFGYALMQPLRSGASVVGWLGGSEDQGQDSAPTTQPPKHLTTQVVGVTALIVDMTRERRLEQELQRAQRLELVGRLSSGIAHDFNNMLQALLGRSELARAGLPADHPVQRDLEQLGDVAAQAISLARQLLAFGSPGFKPGALRTPFQPVEVNHAARRVLATVAPLLPPTITTKLDLEEGDFVIQADAMQLQQVLLNLCLNGRDAMPEGGRLTLRSRFQQGQVCLSVEDSGHGMSEEVRRRVFEPFFSTRERGTGLGLAVVHEVVTGFGGRIEVQSEPGRGTRFDVWLPLREEEDPTTDHTDEHG